MVGLLSVCYAISSHAGITYASEQTETSQLSMEQAALITDRAHKHLLIDIATVGGRVVAVGDRGHILYSDDAGAHWYQAQVPTQTLLTAVHFEGNKGWAVGHDGVVLHTTDAGERWAIQRISTLHTTDPESEEAERAGTPLLDVWFNDAQHGFAVGAYGYFLETVNGGQSWHDIADRLDNLDGFHLNAIKGASNDVVFIAGESGSLFRSMNAGVTWERLSSPYIGSFFGVETAFAPDRLYCYGLEGKLYESRNLGDSWRAIELLTQWSLTHNRVTDSIMGSMSLASGEILFVGNGGLVFSLNPMSGDIQLQHREDRQSLLGVTLIDDQIFVVGKNGVEPYVY